MLRLVRYLRIIIISTWSCALQIDDIRLTPSEVWTPDIEAYNGNKEPTFLANKNTIVVSNSELILNIHYANIFYVLA